MYIFRAFCFSHLFAFRVLVFCLSSSLCSFLYFLDFLYILKRFSIFTKVVKAKHQRTTDRSEGSDAKITTNKKKQKPVNTSFLSNYVSVRSSVRSTPKVKSIQEIKLKIYRDRRWWCSKYISVSLYVLHIIL